MAIYNKSELASLVESRMPTGIAGATSTQDIRNQLTDERDSADLYAGIITGNGDTINVTTSSEIIATFTTNITSTNELFVADQANDAVNQLEPALVIFSLAVQAEWASNVDITIELWTNGVLNPYFQPIVQTGAGPGKTVDMYKQRIAPIGANAPFNFTFPAVHQLKIKGSSATTLTQFYIEFGPKYEAYTIRTI